VGLMVERVEIGEEGLNVQIRVDALGGLARELLSKVGDAVCNGSVFYEPLIFPHHVQPWRDSPNKEINLIPNLKLSPTRTDEQESTRHRTGTTNHNITVCGWQDDGKTKGKSARRTHLAACSVLHREAWWAEGDAVSGGCSKPLPKRQHHGQRAGAGVPVEIWLSMASSRHSLSSPDTRILIRPAASHRSTDTSFARYGRCDPGRTTRP
jgi:hypothetical protein